MYVRILYGQTTLYCAYQFDRTTYPRSILGIITLTFDFEVRITLKVFRVHT